MMVDTLQERMRAALVGYLVQGPPVNAAVKVAEDWAEDQSRLYDRVVKTSRTAQGKAGIAELDGVERQVVADLWAECAEGGWGPIERPVVERVQIWDHHSPTRPRLALWEVRAEVAVRELPTSTRPPDDDNPHVEVESSGDG